MCRLRGIINLKIRYYLNKHLQIGCNIVDLIFKLTGFSYGSYLVNTFLLFLNTVMIRYKSFIVQKKLNAVLRNMLCLGNNLCFQLINKNFINIAYFLKA